LLPNSQVLAAAVSPLRPPDDQDAEREPAGLPGAG
jgi:hypothetical protein